MGALESPGAGTGADKVIGNGAAWPSANVMFAGSPIEGTGATCTCVLADAKPGAEAVMVAALMPMPWSAGNVDVVLPGGMKTLAGLTDTNAGLLLVSVTNAPFAPAGTERPTGNGAVPPGFNVEVAGNTITGGPVLSSAAVVRYTAT